ncbi:hypothetical protein HZS_4726 [Henneguya salminicola]|nr:hypothetical protein HZS_4726 [Henneguya salminicola]
MHTTKQITNFIRFTQLVILLLALLLCFLTFYLVKILLQIFKTKFFYHQDNIEIETDGNCTLNYLEQPPSYHEINPTLRYQIRKRNPIRQANQKQY